MYSKNSQYGFLILETLKDGPKKPQEVADKHNLNRYVLATVASMLRKHGLLVNTPGMKIHQRWALPDRPVTMRDVLEATRKPGSNPLRAVVPSFKSIKYVVELDKYHDETRVV